MLNVGISKARQLVRKNKLNTYPVMAFSIERKSRRFIKSNGCCGKSGPYVQSAKGGRNFGGDVVKQIWNKKITTFTCMGSLPVKDFVEWHNEVQKAAERK
ncbi:hypothetical protein D3C75_538290 [compost metagenome]